MVLCDVRWSDAKDCSYGDSKNYTGVLGVFMRVETERMYLYPLSDEEMRQPVLDFVCQLWIWQK